MGHHSHTANKITIIIVFLVISKANNSSINNCQYYKIDSGNITRCTICAANYELNLNYTKCLPCSEYDAYCLRCDINSNGTIFCQACIDGYQVIGSKCSNVDGCNDAHCNSCSPPSQCLTCNVGYFIKPNTTTCSPCPVSNQLDQGNGECACDSGTFLLTSQSNSSICANCEYPCQTCAQSASYCTLCIYGYFMNPRSFGSCSLCLTPNCIICQSQHVCLACTLGYSLSNGICEIQLQQQNIKNYINLP
jgi:hypothetical protein